MLANDSGQLRCRFLVDNDDKCPVVDKIGVITIEEWLGLSLMLAKIDPQQEELLESLEEWPFFS